MAARRQQERSRPAPLRGRRHRGCWAPLRIALVALTLWAAGSARAEVRYAVDLTERAQHRVTVELTITDPGGPLELWMPVWTPGAYELRTWGRNVTALGGQDGDGRHLAVTRMGPSRFVVAASGRGPVRLRYRVYAPRLLDDGSHVDGEHALLNGSSLFLAVRGQEQRRHTVRVALPPGWRLATALDEERGTLVASSYETLIDAPIECGPFADTTVVAAGRQYHIVLHGAARVPPRFARDVARLVEAEVAMVGPPPYSRYTLLLHLTDEPDDLMALEHASSASILAPRGALTRPGDYDQLRYVVAHELFHAWNARRLRPAELVPYTLLQPQPSRALYLTEGLAEYFAHRALLRSGIWSPAAYLAHLAMEAERAVRAAGTGRSIEEDSLLAWQAPDDSAATPDGYYARGHLFALALDAAMRAESEGRHTLAQVMRTLLQEAERRGGVLPLDTDGLAAAVEARVPGLGAQVRAWARQGDETAALQASLARLGLVLSIERRRPLATAGFELSRRGRRWWVVSVEAGGPAELAGLMTGDELVTLDGSPVDAGYARQIAGEAPGEVLLLGVRRRGRRTLRLTLAARSEARCSVDLPPVAPGVARLRQLFLSAEKEGIAAARQAQ